MQKHRTELLLKLLCTVANTCLSLQNDSRRVCSIPEVLCTALRIAQATRALIMVNTCPNCALLINTSLTLVGTYLAPKMTTVACSCRCWSQVCVDAGVKCVLTRVELVSTKVEDTRRPAGIQHTSAAALGLCCSINAVATSLTTPIDTLLPPLLLLL